MSPVTVVIGTHTERRIRYLVRAVESAYAQSPAPAEVIVVVDHNEALLHLVGADLPMVTALPNRYDRGASGTRNTGAQHARTPLVAFLDDDAAARPQWLERLIAPFTDRDVVGTGGGVEPVWQAGRPAWFPGEFGWVVGASYVGMPTTRERIRNVWSENMAVRREVFAAVGGFRLGFGKVGDRSRPEDTDLCIRMAATAPAAHWMHVPDAVADHQVPADRSTLQFFLRRCYQEGQGKVEMARLISSTLVGAPATLDSERDYLRRTIPRGLARGARETLRGGGFAGMTRSAAICAGVAAVGIGAALRATRPVVRPAATPVPAVSVVAE